LPLLALHGGPGGCRLPLEALAPLAEQGRQVVFFDQLGSGESSRPDDPSLWRVETFVEQVQSVRDALGLDEIHLFGSSWGGMLALEYAFTQPEGLASGPETREDAGLPLPGAGGVVRDAVGQHGEPEQLLPGVLIAVAPRGEHLGKTSARLHTLAECSAGPIAVSCFVGVVRC